MGGKLKLGGVAAALLICSSIAAANVVVVKSIGPSARQYPAGKTLPESATISLKPGDMVILLGPGSAKTLRGPGTFDTKQINLTSAAGARGRFSSLRAAEIARNPGIWDIDISESGKVCVTNPAQLKVWRDNSEEATTVKIRSAEGNSQKLTWAAGKTLANWPAALPIKSHATYQVEWTGTGETSSVDVITIPAPRPDDLVGAAQALIENGCQKQLDLLVQSANKAPK